MMTGRGARTALIAAWLVAGACGDTHERSTSGDASPDADSPENSGGSRSDAGAAGARAPRSDRHAFCGRADDDVSDEFCALEPSMITSLAELRQALDFDGTLLLGHSTGLGGRFASPINPRAIAVRTGSAGSGFAALAFTRGEQRVEMLSLDRTTARFNFYLLEFTQACSAEPEGCSFGDLFTPAIESDWLELNVRDDEELKNTKDDCRRCHGGGPHDPDKPMLLMRELARPWMHWFSIESVTTLRNDFRAARGDEPYAATNVINDAGGLESVIVKAQRDLDLPPQPLSFRSHAIGTETQEIMGTGRGPGADDHELAESPTWRVLYDAYRSGRALAPPYHHERITDPDKLASATAAYQTFLAGEIERDDLPDISDVLPDDQGLLAQMSFAVEPDAVEGDLLIQACGECHNAGLDPSLSRARFDADLSRVQPEALAEAVARLELPQNDPLAMPPAGSRTMSAAQRRGLIAYLRTVDPADVPGRPSPRLPRTTFALEVGYEFHDPELSPGIVAIADLTGDGRPDLLAAPYVFAQNENGTLSDPTPLPAGASYPSAVLDVDRNGWIDLVAEGPGGDNTTATRGLVISLASELGFATAIASAGPSIGVPYATDVDRDGHLDLVARVGVVGHWNYPVVAYLGDGAGGFTPQEVVLEDSPVDRVGGIALGEVTGDGLDDLVLCDTRSAAAIVVHAHDAAQGFAAAPARYPLPVQVAGSAYLAIGDADDDGRNDVVVSAESSIFSAARVLLQREDGGFAPPPEIDAAEGPLVFADMDRDGRDDLVTLFKSRGIVSVLLQPPGGLQHAQRLEFRVPDARTSATSTLADSLAVGDLDANGCLDVAVARTRLVAVLYGSGCER